MYILNKRVTTIFYSAGKKRHDLYITGKTNILSVLMDSSRDAFAFADHDRVLTLL